MVIFIFQYSCWVLAQLSGSRFIKAQLHCYIHLSVYIVCMYVLCACVCECIHVHAPMQACTKGLVKKCAICVRFGCIYETWLQEIANMSINYVYLLYSCHTVIGNMDYFAPTEGHTMLQCFDSCCVNIGPNNFSSYSTSVCDFRAAKCFSIWTNC